MSHAAARALFLTLSLGALLASPASAQATRADVHGTYRVQGTARVNAGAVLPSAMDVHADVVLRPDAGRGGVLARIRSAGHACELAARLAGDGTLAFAPGQVCLVRLDSPEMAGRIESRLVSGHGRVTTGTLDLELTWQLGGSLQPAPWSPSLPVNGTASATARGRRDNSRASQ